MHVKVDDEVAVALHDLGGEGPPLLLCHATGFHGMVWRPFAAALADRWHCWALDFRGHGDSPVPPGHPMDWNGFVDDALAVADALGGRQLRAVGHSKGGAALIAAEVRRPGTFSALWVYEPIVIPPIPRELWPVTADSSLATGAARRRATFASREEAFANYAGKPPLSVLDRDALAAYVEHGFADDDDGSVRLKCRPEVEADVYRMGPRLGAWDHLPELRCRLTVAAGGDEGHPARVAPVIAEQVPGARFERYDDLGHFGPLEAPARLAQAADRFLAG